MARTASALVVAAAGASPPQISPLAPCLGMTREEEEGFFAAVFSFAQQAAATVAGTRSPLR